MSNILDKIVAQKQIEVKDRKQQTDLTAVINLASKAAKPRPFKQSILERIFSQSSAVIAEVKKASPSKGVIREKFDPAWIARQYESHGACCLSVLTDEQFFQGHDDYLVEVKNACQLPVLRKDFIVDEYQVYEARALGADCVLLIVSILDDEQLLRFHQVARSIDLNVLVEVHDEQELIRALAINPDILGINNRNLKTFEVSLDTTIDLSAGVPEDTPIITESGILDRSSVERMHQEGVFGFLVGEAFMREENPGKALSNMFRG